jgi:FAD/FMN-containing dehydrogenase
MLLSEEVKKVVKGEIFDDPTTLTKFSHDASIFEVRPQLVVAPKDAQDIKALVKLATAAKEHNENVSITARAAGTCMSGGPLSESIVLDMTAHFNQIWDVEVSADKKSGFAVVDPGVYYRDFDKETKRRDLFMPTYPASRELATVGGMVANNAGGEKTPAYGKTEKFIEELHVVLADGEEHVIKGLTQEELAKKITEDTFEGKLYKQMYELIHTNKAAIDAARPNVTKNSAGYYLWNVWDGKTFDLNKIIVGSQGTFGIITKIKFRLVPVRPISKMLVLFLKQKHMKDLGHLVVGIKEFGPETIESYDDNTLKLAVKFFPDLLKILKPKNLLGMFFNLLPEVWLFVTGGMPKLVVMAEFTGETQKEVDERIQAAAAAVKKFGIKMHITKTDEEERAFYTIRRESFSLLRNKVKDKHTAPFIDDFAVLPEVLPEFLPKLTAILSQYPSLVFTIAGHPGDGNFHIIPLMQLEDQSQRSIIPKLSEEVYSLVLQYKGTTTAEHNDGLVRTPYLEKMYGAEIVKLFEQTKKIFDPQGIFNPGKKVGGSMAYSMGHIRKSF